MPCSHNRCGRIAGAGSDGRTKEPNPIRVLLPWRNPEGSWSMRIWLGSMKRVRVRLSYGAFRMSGLQICCQALGSASIARIWEEILISWTMPDSILAVRRSPRSTCVGD